MSSGCLKSLYASVKFETSICPFGATRGIEKRNWLEDGATETCVPHLFKTLYTSHSVHGTFIIGKDAQQVNSLIGIVVLASSAITFSKLTAIDSVIPIFSILCTLVPLTIKNLSLHEFTYSSWDWMLKWFSFAKSLISSKENSSKLYNISCSRSAGRPISTPDMAIYGLENW